MRDPIKAYAVVKYTTSSSKRPSYSVDLDTGTLPTHLPLASATSAIPLQFITKHDPNVTIDVEAWSFEAATAHELARKDCENFWETAGEHSFRILGKESSFVGGTTRYWIAVEEAERAVRTKKAWVFSMGKTLRGRERREDEAVAREKLWLWWDVVEVVED